MAPTESAGKDMQAHGMMFNSGPLDCSRDLLESCSCRCVQYLCWPQEGTRFLGAGDVGGCEAPDVGIRNTAQVLSARKYSSPKMSCWLWPHVGQWTTNIFSESCGQPHAPSGHTFPQLEPPSRRWVVRSSPSHRGQQRRQGHFPFIHIRLPGTLKGFHHLWLSSLGLQMQCGPLSRRSDLVPDSRGVSTEDSGTVDGGNFLCQAVKYSSY